MVNKTPTGGSSQQFPRTRWSAIIATGSADPSERSRAYEVLIATYWKPVYKYVRIKWNKSNEDAEDLTQGFFLTAMEKQFFKRYDPARARFRTFLRACLDGYVANEKKAAARIKRGGKARILSLDFGSAEDELQDIQRPDEGSMEAYFEREWLRSLFGLAVEEMREEFQQSGKSLQFCIFERYDLHREDTGSPLTYGKLAEEFSLPVTKVTNYLTFARREFRRILLQKLREITANDSEFRQEARFVLGTEPP